MNREQRRTYEKKLRAKGVSKSDAENIVALKQKLDSVEPLPEGQRVRLNIKSIMEHPDYERLTDRYKQFVQDNKDNVFTVEYDPQHLKNPTLVCLKEDPTPVKWIWWVGDLEIVKEEQQ